MKKIILVLIGLFIGSICFAGPITDYPVSTYIQIEPGGSSCQADNCIVWREGMTTGGGNNYCKSSNGCDTTKRLYELETAVKTLQQQAIIASSQSNIVCDDSDLIKRVKVLEDRMSTVEQTIEKLNKTIGDSLRNIISILLARK